MKIAVCEDDRTTREQIAALIKKQEPSAEVITFETGEDMIKSQENFVITFLDIEMKEKSGIDVAKHMRAEQEKRGREKNIIIFVTGYREYMEIENSFAREIIMNKASDLPESSKTNKKFHGMGLTNIQRCARKYKGILTSLLILLSRNSRYLILQ